MQRTRSLYEIRHDVWTFWKTLQTGIILVKNTNYGKNIYPVPGDQKRGNQGTEIVLRTVKHNGVVYFIVSIQYVCGWESEL